jgi:hypothetical protein
VSAAVRPSPGQRQRPVCPPAPPAASACDAAGWSGQSCPDTRWSRSDNRFLICVGLASVPPGGRVASTLPGRVPRRHPSSVAWRRFCWSLFLRTPSQQQRVASLLLDSPSTPPQRRRVASMSLVSVPSDATRVPVHAGPCSIGCQVHLPPECAQFPFQPHVSTSTHPSPSRVPSGCGEGLGVRDSKGLGVRELWGWG